MFKLTQVPYLHCWQCVWKTKCVAHGTVNAKRTMMTSSNGNIFRITIPFWGESTGHRWIPLIKASDTELCCFLRSVPEQTNIWANNRDAGNLRRHRAHYDITVMAVKTVLCVGLGELLNKKMCLLQWRPMSVGSNHQQLNRLFNGLFKKMTDPFGGESTGGPLDSPHKGSVMRKTFLCHDAIMTSCEI